MTAYELADYLINHDCEPIIIHRQIDYVLEMIRDEGWEADFDTAWEALEIAASDPYIKSVAELMERPELCMASQEYASRFKTTRAWCIPSRWTNTASRLRRLPSSRSATTGHEGFGRIPTYVCDCGMEYWAWQDVLDHLALLVPDGCWHMSYTADAVGRDICQNCGQVFDDGVPVYP